MRKAIGIGVLVCIFSGYSIGQPQWSTPTPVSPGSCPDFVINKISGRLHIVTMYKGVTYTVMDSLGNIISQEQIPGANKDRGTWYNGASVALDFNGKPHFVYRIPLADNRYDIYYINKVGANWSASLKVVGNLRRGYCNRLAVDKSGKVHMAVGFVPEGNLIPYGSVNYYIIANGAVVTSLTKTNLGPFRTDSRLEMDVTSDGTVHLILGSPDLSHGQIPYYRMSNGGNTLTKVGDLHNIQCTNRNGMPDVFVDDLDRIHFCYGARVDQAVNDKLSMRYLRWESGQEVKDVCATREDDLLVWKGTDLSGWGLGSVAASSDGGYIGLAYLRLPQGALKWIYSTDGGTNWSESTDITAACGGPYEAYEGRDIHVIRAYRNHFYCVYPTTDGNIRLTMLRNVGDEPPQASAGGPYNGNEGSPVQLNASASVDAGQNSGIVEYAWDWEMDGVFDFTTASPTASYTFADDFNGNVVLRVTDRGGMTDLDTTQVTILNVAPTVSIGSDITCFEGDTLDFTAVITDPGSDTHEISWSFGDGTPASTGLIQTHFYRDEGAGRFTVACTVTDDDGGSGNRTIAATVRNAPPQANPGGPYFSAPDVPVEFRGSGYDPGLDDILSYSWDLDNNGTFEVSGQNATKTYSAIGTYQVRFRVRDNDGGEEIETVNVRISRDAPNIVGLQTQVVQEGQAFPPLNLDNYVTDADNAPDQMTWQVTGAVHLQPAIQSRTLVVVIPDADWNGQEILTLTVQDPTGFTDSEQVTFVVQPVNDAPRWKTKEHFTMNEDDTLTFTFANLRARVEDIDDDPSVLRFSLTGNQKVRWTENLQGQVFLIHLEPNWFGQETVQFVVSDDDGAHEGYACQITAISQPDPPASFNLQDPLYVKYYVWPDSIRFRWNGTTDPDSQGQIYYEWKFWPSSGDYTTTPYMGVSLGLSARFVPVPGMSGGTYFWRVWAWDDTGLSRNSSNVGIVVVDLNTDVDEPEPLPTEYRLLPNYPNPFNPETRIAYHIPEACQVTLTVFNMLGQKIRVLVQETQDAGVHTAVWDGRDETGQPVVSGLYVYRMDAGGHHFIRKMALLR